MHALILRAGSPRMVRPMYHLVVPGGISPTESFIIFLVKLAQSSAFLQDIAFATKDPKICNVGLSLFQWMTIKTVAIKASRVDSFGLRRLTHIVLTKHRPCHINEYSIFSLNKTI